MKKIWRRLIAGIVAICMFLPLISVEASTEKTDSNLQKAQKLLQSSSYKYWKTCLKPHEAIVNGLKNKSMFHFATEFFAGELNPLNDGTKFYCMVLIDLIQNQNQFDQAVQNADERFDENVEYFVEEAIDLAGNAIDAATTIDNIDDEIMQTVYGLYELSSDAIKAIDYGVKPLLQVAKEASTLYTLKGITDQTIKNLDDIKKVAQKRGNKELANAVDAVTEKIKTAQAGILENVNEAIHAGVDELMGSLAEDTVSLLFTSWGLGPVVAGYHAGRLLSNIIAGADELSKTYKTMACLDTIENCLLESMSDDENTVKIS